MGAFLELSIANTKIDCSKALQMLPSMPWIGQIKVLSLAGTDAVGSFEAFRGVRAFLELSIANTKIDCSKALELLPSARRGADR